MVSSCSCRRVFAVLSTLWDFGAAGAAADALGLKATNAGTVGA